jgi:phosphoribosylformylglycinamidine (FGAM) synthase-like enzyme
VSVWKEQARRAWLVHLEWVRANFGGGRQPTERELKTLRRLWSAHRNKEFIDLCRRRRIKPPAL